MTEIAVELRNVQGSGAALGWAGAHTVVVDRPEGRAGGTGLGFNGGQLLALAIGGCFCNDLRYAADQLGLTLGDIDVSVVLQLEGAPLVTTGAKVTVVCELADGSDAREVVERATAICTVANSVRAGFPVTFQSRT
jgi:organic hydroperoxide reductase OsmC/OhrA